MLEKPWLKATFRDIGLNEAGNIQKHDIEDINIDMTRCVTAYNNLVNSVIETYGLTALKKLIVKKHANIKLAKEEVKKPMTTQQRSKKKTTQRAGVPLETAQLVNDELKLKATLTKGMGRYTKGLFGKKDMVNFKLSINIQNKQGLKISSIKAYIRGRGDETEKKLPNMLSSVTTFDLPADSYGGNVAASVVVVYKIGMFKSKQMKVTVSKDF